jgi:methionyl-tRNA formyltransferase
MRIVYMGTPQFAVGPLSALHAAGHVIVGAVARTDKPAGRGRELAEPAVKIKARELGIPVFQPKRVRDPEFIAVLRNLQPDAIVVAAYGQILSAEILFLPKFGCINIHASLLPAYRGAAPINWAIVNGDAETGITIMRMDEGMDTGAILLQESIPIEPADTAGSFAPKLAALGARLIVQALPLIEANKLPPQSQDNAKATLAPILKKEDGRIDWNLPAIAIHNRARGLSPWPGAFSFFEGKLVKIIETAPEPGTAEPGLLSVQDKDVLLVGSGRGLLRILKLQPEGKKPMSAGEFLRGHRNLQGRKFEARISKS